MAVGDPESDRHHKKNAPDHPPGFGPTDFPPYEYHPYPKWIYHERDGSRIVQSAEEHANYQSRGGWVENPNDTRKAWEALELEKSDNAAQRASDDHRMSDKAKSEHAAADEAADDHVLDLPAGKLDKSKSKKKAAEAAEN